MIYYWTDAGQTGIYLFYMITKQITTHKAFVYFKILQHNASLYPVFAHFGEDKKEAIWRNLRSIQNEAISLVTMRSKELWLVSEKNHATVKPDSSVASHGIKTYSESRIRGGGGVALGRILFVLPKMWSKLELSLMRLLWAKFGKICHWTKKIKDTVVYGWGTQIFPKSPKQNKN